MISNYLSKTDRPGEVSVEISANWVLRGVLRKIFSFPVFLGAVLSAGTLAITASNALPIVGGKLFASADIWWLAAVGERVLSSHTWPVVDGYSFTVQGNAWVVYAWLGGVALALATRLGGLQGLAALFVLSSVALVLLLYYYAWLRSRNVKASAVSCALLLPILGPQLSLRTQLLGYLCLTISLISLERFRQGHRRALWVLPPIFLLWVNTHGSFVLGFLALGVHWACGLFDFHSSRLVASRWTPRQRRDLLSISLACLLTVTLTPYGTRLAFYPLEMMLLQRLDFLVTPEWLPPSLSAVCTQVFVALVALFLIAQLVSPAMYRLDETLLTLFMAYESCRYERFLLAFVVVFAPLLARLLGRWLPPYEPAKDHPFLNASLLAVFAWAAVASFPSSTRLQEALSRVYPVRAASHLGQNLRGLRVYTADAWGSYLIWGLHGEQKVFVDGRFDLYEYGGVLADYVNIESLSPQTALLLQRYAIEGALIGQDAPIKGYFEASPDWVKTYEDSTGALFVRGTPRLR